MLGQIKCHKVEQKKKEGRIINFGRVTSLSYEIDTADVNCLQWKLRFGEAKWQTSVTTVVPFPNGD